MVEIEDDKWYRVTERMSPLCGCDVLGEIALDEFGEQLGFLLICKLRRVDVFVGDRPFQLVASPNESLGLLIDYSHLDESPLQEDIIEMSVSSPYGKCLNEDEYTRPDGLILRVVTYSKAVQVALEDPGSGLIAAETFIDNNINPRPLNRAIEIHKQFESNVDSDEIVGIMRRN